LSFTKVQPHVMTILRLSELSPLQNRLVIHMYIFELNFTNTREQIQRTPRRCNVQEFDSVKNVLISVYGQALILIQKER